MTPATPSLSALQTRVVRALSESRSTLDAAALLNMSQSALSRHVKSAEAQLGVGLFQRGWSGSEATSAGDVVARQCQRIMATLEQLDARALPAPSRLTVHARWRHLRTVATVARCGSASVAGQILKVRQPAISQTLREAAGFAGQPLFQRRRTGLEATEAGLRLAAGWDEIAADLAQIPQLVAQSTVGLTGRVAVGMLPFSGQNLVVETFADLMQDHPHVRLMAIPGSYSLLCQALSRGEIDLILGGLRGAPYQAGFVEAPLYDEEFVMIARRDHPVHASPQTLESLARQHWSVAPHGTPTRHYFEGVFRDISPPPQTQPCEIFSFSNAEQMIMSSESIAMLCYSEDRLRALHPALRRVQIALPDARVPIGLTRMADNPVPGAVAVFLTRLKSRIARLEGGLAP